MFNFKLGHLLLTILILSVQIVDSLSTTTSHQIQLLALAINVPFAIAWRRRRRAPQPVECNGGQKYTPTCTACPAGQYLHSNVKHRRPNCNSCSGGTLKIDLFLFTFSVTIHVFHHDKN